MTNFWFFIDNYFTVISTIYKTFVCVLFSEFEFYGAKSFMQKNPDCQGRKMSRQNCRLIKGDVEDFNGMRDVIKTVVNQRFYQGQPSFLSGGGREKEGKFPLFFLIGFEI